MLPYEIIEKKQQGDRHSPEEIRFMVKEFTAGNIPDYQISAWLMAIYFQGFSIEETAVLVEAMIESGERIDLSDISGYKIDKHSTGGVGDKVTLILAPLVAAAGVKIPMISGRGLGHTGGTLDKLESIPGFTTDYSIDDFRRQVDEFGVCIMGQSATMVPADKKMYALRDVTATVRSIPLICGSIMSKKIAEGIDGLVLDVKTGRGAFIAEEEKSRELANQLADIGKEFGLDVRVVITDMNQPLGNQIGNRNEVVESVECLKGNGPADLMEVTMELSAEMLVLAGKAEDVPAAKTVLNELIETGEALEKFYDLVEIQGGDPKIIDSLLSLEPSKFSVEVTAPAEGIVQSLDSYQLGTTSVKLGAGRMQMGDVIDPKAGISLERKIGDRVNAGDVLAVCYTDKESVVEEAKQSILDVFEIDDADASPPTMIHEVIGDET
ncbi:MAG: thymidine phosphorylase [Candidatus Marinimicrobia bacterium]|nr:thymidine phosphorylase [Candidatus Neomarinimicrobiota bacterium]MCF7828881.1 thymidine phosphorylase [Candidatus Neomarinimicrobiota bacterium]MCF7880799.1 thymidine phosphorylase [Candidatus Neomarinimicrobiota bacterium]